MDLYIYLYIYIKHFGRVKIILCYHKALSNLWVLSQGLGETFGRVTIEAMAFGLPVITS